MREELTLQGVIDLHVHAAPDVIPRKVNELDLVECAKSVGMRSVLLKCHHALTADRAWLLRKMIVGFEVFGGLVLNTPSTGGLNPQAVDTAIKLGAKEIWMPTISSAYHLRQAGGDLSHAITILSKNGTIVSEAIDIIKMIAKANIILGTGHLSIDETRKLVECALDLGVEKILVTHPESRLIQMPIDVQRELAKKGAIMEHCYLSAIGSKPLSPQEIAEQIRSVGVEHCVIATELGQEANPHPVEGMLSYMESMFKCGFAKREIEMMTNETPARLLDLATE